MNTQESHDELNCRSALQRLMAAIVADAERCPEMPIRIFIETNGQAIDQSTHALSAMPVNVMRDWRSAQDALT